MHLASLLEQIKLQATATSAQTVSGWATALLAGPTDESGQTLSFNVSNDNSDLFSVAPAIDASGNLTYTPEPGTDGTAIITVTLMDDGDTVDGGINTSPARNFTITVSDTTAPAAPTVDSFNDDTGTVGDNITGDNLPLFSGTAEANSTVEVLLNSFSIGTTIADSFGKWTYNYNSIPLPDDTYSVMATSTDAAGNSTSSAAPLIVTIDAGTPSPVITTPIEGDNLINATEQTNVLVAGTAEPDAIVAVTISDSDNPDITTQVTADSSGNWTLFSNELDVSPLNEGALTVSAIATDAAGNVSNPATTNVTLDTVAPSLPTITTPIEGDNVINVSEQTDVLVAGTAEANTAVDITISDGTSPDITVQVTADSSGD